MSQALPSGPPIPPVGSQPRRSLRARWLNRTVIGAGVTSALGDFCYETTSVILPGFVAVLGIPAAALGTIEGFADAVASIAKLLSGHIADKLGHRKVLVMLGYALTPMGQLFIAPAIGWPMILFGRVVAWFGKGLRGPLRDAIVTQAVDPETRGRAFGFHRAMDTVGAVIGPLLGVALLGWAHSLGSADRSFPFRLVLWLSAIPGALAVLAFLTLVNDPEQLPNPALRFFGALRRLPTRFRRYLSAVAVFGAGDFSHTLLVLAATQILTPTMGVLRAAQVAGLLYVGRNIVQVAASYPIGALADRHGAARVLSYGYALGALTAILIALTFALGNQNVWLLVAVFAGAGLYVATQEALEAPVTVAIVGASTLATSYGALGAVNGTTKLISSAAVGALWTLVSPAFGFSVAAILMTIGTLMLARTPKREPAR